MSMQSIVAYVLVMIAAYFLIKKLFFSKKKGSCGEHNCKCH
ncbi:FeoB-associated Cys-rich membrane protein [Capnocytophaga sp. Marseille-Q4570]|uniref:FeoB-associated Cys-rich membrane protein n=1 Tax=Capnocytophaga bilenii TaxID=2819369 RepID=A0ABS3PVG6_9FLAO|nr:MULTISPECIES: FeoB-associated Cys-rich membrane protein [Capnocytophaga]EKY07969.1 hypothetical protein HMPREF9075_01849 [Capnocytophaga sp. oral taxon 332 str. F0381]MBO1883312.1 FeoB-associated Cys-rich membrane protein [Capnocytophaga bilenii]